MSETCEIHGWRRANEPCPACKRPTPPAPARKQREYEILHRCEHGAIVRLLPDAVEPLTSAQLVKIVCKHSRIEGNYRTDFDWDAIAKELNLPSLRERGGEDTGGVGR